MNEYELIQKLQKLSSEYMGLETDNLANAGEFSRLSWEIEEVAMQICRRGTNITEDELINFLDSRKIKSKSSFRTIKITAGMTQEFEIIMTDAPDDVIKLQLMHISVLEEEGKTVPENPYWLIEEFGYVCNCLGCQDDFSYDDLKDAAIDAEFDYYDI